MDNTTGNSDDDANTGTAMNRRAFFGRAVAMVGAAGALMGLTGCPGGDQDDDDDDEDGDDDD